MQHCSPSFSCGVLISLAHGLTFSCCLAGRQASLGRSYYICHSWCHHRNWYFRYWGRQAGPPSCFTASETWEACPRGYLLEIWSPLVGLREPRHLQVLGKSYNALSQWEYLLHPYIHPWPEPSQTVQCYSYHFPFAFPLPWLAWLAVGAACTIWGMEVVLII